MASYITKSGDMWDKIAHDTMGSERYMPLLMEANPEHRDVYLFSAGVTLEIPAVTEKVNSRLPPWKRGDV